MTSRFLPWALSVVLSITLAGCGTLERPYASSRSTPLEVAYHEEVRTRSSDPETMASFSAEMTALLQAERPLTVLALSGGGANGAYGAGVLVGWSRRGDRPTFDVVTGVSTGALAAPFAFLGPDWDDELSDAYTSGKTSGLVGLDNLAALFQPSLFSAAPLRRLVDTNVTPELLQAIATEHAKGRRLLVATTNLDQEETVIWDMGQLATQGDEPSHNLFKEILVASASIPGVFPPS
ncbi:patatin-like phospholipase family protein [Brevundimonas diminuta]|uniref:patatin-like phospholipase family protein n=1 Tax=Brevundimonas diminuta TaxID=293 RepID=UPI003D9A1573